MLVNDRIEGTPHPWGNGRVHEAQHDDSRDRCEACANSQHERQADAQQAKHEQPIHGRHGEGLEEGRQGLSGRGARQVALCGRSAVNPRARGPRRIVQAEHLVQERPQEDEADRDSQQSQDEARGLGGDDG